MMSAPILSRLSDPAPLEDDVTLVMRKAMRGMGLDIAALAAESTVSVAEIERFLGGNFSCDMARAVAPRLGLNADAMATLPVYRPNVPIMHSVSRLVLPFEKDQVNAWLIRDEDQALLFDTGYLPDSAATLVSLLGVADLNLFLTHDHRDHVGGIAALRPILKKQHMVPLGQTVSLGSLQVKCIDLAGHCIPSWGYVIEGLSRVICVTGDALFAGSIGGCADQFTYQMALRNIRQHVLSLPGDTILLPGHGPATTVAQELRRNPFVSGKTAKPAPEEEVNPMKKRSNFF
jgi:glyoxylase-like metal-dependent hydrolase (beta-lactamase superfamily II)